MPSIALSIESRSDGPLPVSFTPPTFVAPREGSTTFGEARATGQSKHETEHNRHLLLLGRRQLRKLLARDLDLDSALHLNQVRILLDGLEDGIDASRSHLGELCGAQPDLRRGAFYLFCGEG